MNHTVYIEGVLHRVGRVYGCCMEQVPNYNWHSVVNSFITGAKGKQA